MGALAAFERAFARDERACLILKVNSHREVDPREAPHLRRLVDAVARVPNVHVVH